MRLRTRDFGRLWVSLGSLILFKANEIATVVVAHRDLRYEHWCLRLERRGSLVCGCITAKHVLREQDERRDTCD
jgi:hypothetical protein